MVKALNNIYFEYLIDLARSSHSPERSVLAIAGDDSDAKKSVAALFDDLGFDAYDAGPLAEGWRYQRDTAAYGVYSASPAGVWPPKASRQVTQDLLRDRLAQAKRYRDMVG